MSRPDFTPAEKLAEVRAILALLIQVDRRRFRQTGAKTAPYMVRRIQILKAIAVDIQEHPDGPTEDLRRDQHVDRDARAPTGA